MDGSVLKDKIGQKRSRYKEQYRILIENISKKGDTSGNGDFSSFGLPNLSDRAADGQPATAM
jgi:hypothetical protein